MEIHAFNVPHPPPRKKTMIAAAKPSSEISGSHAEFIERHSTIISFHHSDLDPLSPVKGWVPTPLKPNDPLDPNDWYYVELSGEQITFVADMVNPDIDTKSLRSLPIRHLGHTLKSAYTASGGYKDDTGVFTITKGTLSVCSHNGSPDGHPARTDTKLTLKIDQKLIILGSGNKSITLFPGAAVFIGNIPLSFAKTGVPTPKAHEHYKKYCEMVGDTACKWPPADLAVEQRTYQVYDCGQGLAYRRTAGHQESENQPPFGNPTLASDYACSNTQWP